MDVVNQAELAVNLFLQSLEPALQSIMRVITMLGDQIFYILFMPTIYWCVDAWAGLRIGVMLLTSASFNGFFKVLLKGPRPYWISDKIVPGVYESSFGIPSGHAMNSTAVWGWSALETKNRKAILAAIVMVLLIAVSRLVLGVHFLSDVLLGLVLGLLLLIFFSKLQKPLGGWLKKQGLKNQILLAFLSSLFLIGLPAMVIALSSDWQMPAGWAARAGDVNPLSLEGALTTAGLWFGMLGGFAWLRARRGVLQSNFGTWQRIARYLVGIAGVIVLYAGLGSIFPDDPGLLSAVLRYFRYFLIGLWIACLSPLLFEKMKIGRIEPDFEPQTTAPLK
jgi:membrane-associated phospholipid phosphatase